MNFDYKERLIYSCLAGSHLYGTAGPDSDTDVRAVLISPPSYYFGLDSFEEHEPVDEEDAVYRDIRKFIRLALKGNPSILEQFYAPSQSILTLTVWGERLRKLAPEFITEKAISAHLGMADAHYQRMYEPYRKCGKKGKEAIEKYGYNTRDVCIVFRVLQQCVELIETGKMVFPRPNTEELLRIKNGAYTHTEILGQAEEVFGQALAAREKADLPKKPNYDKVNREVVDIVNDYLHFKKDI